MKIHREYIIGRMSDLEDSGLVCVGSHQNHRRFGEFYETVAFEDSTGNLWGETFLCSSEDGFIDAFWEEDNAEYVTLKPVEAYDIIRVGYRIKE